MIEEVAQTLQVVSILTIALGIGFIASAFASYAMSRQLGLDLSRTCPMRDAALSTLDQLDAAAAEAEGTFQMDEDAFRLFYERTSRPVLGLSGAHVGKRAALADDLLQETYYRFLRANVPYESDAHRRNYLFRIATNYRSGSAPASDAWTNPVPATLI